MRYALLVAWREFAENVKAKGFWIGIFLLPCILFLSIRVPILLEQKATPTRYFVLVDQSGQFATVIRSALEMTYQRGVLEALKDYVQKNMKEGQPYRVEFKETDPQSLKEFIEHGGQETVLSQIRSDLKPGSPAFNAPRRLVSEVKLPAELDSARDLSTLADGLKPYLRGEKQVTVDGQKANLHAAILLPGNIEEQILRPAGSLSPSRGSTRGIEYWSSDVTASKGGFGLAHEVEQAINTEVRRREYLKRGIDGAAIRQVEQTYIPFVGLNPKKEKGQEAVNATDVIRQWAPSAFVYLLWLAIFVIVQMLLNNTIEEKSNRIIEVLLSSVTPGELMMGKLFGIAAVGLTMVAAWMIALFSILSWQSEGASQFASQALTVLKASNLVPMFAVYFLLGYLMYAAFILSIGSVCNTIKEAQSYMGVITMLMMVPLLTMTFIPKDPNGTLARILSWIPIYTPFTMMNRAAADPPWIDLIGTLILMLISTAVALWMCGKIFRIGILRTGQPPKVIEMLRWATRSKS